MVDMHIHTTYSDGIDSVEKIVALAKDFSLFSITDHNNIEAAKIVTAPNFITGSEISINGSDLSLPKDLELHLLAYNFDPYNDKLGRMFEEYKYYNNLVFTKIFINIILKNHFKIDPHILEQYKDESLNKVSICRILLSQGIGQDIYDVYKRYVKEFCTEKNYYISFRDVLSNVKESGGHILFAHPYEYKLSPSDVNGVVDRLYKAGIDGVELDKNNPERTMYFVKKYDLLYSIGSDYHGETLHTCNTLGLDDSRYICDKNYIKTKIKSNR